MPRNAGRPSMSLFVRNVAYDMTDDELRRVFLKYGHVRDVYVPKDYHTQEPRGFAYVQFEDIRDAEDAQYYVNGSRLRGREMEVQFAEGDRKTPGQMRGRPESPRRRSRSPRRRSRSPGKVEYSRLPRQRSPRRSRSPNGRVLEETSSLGHAPCPRKWLMNTRRLMKWKSHPGEGGGALGNEAFNTRRSSMNVVKTRDYF